MKENLHVSHTDTSLRRSPTSGARRFEIILASATCCALLALAPLTISVSNMETPLLLSLAAVFALMCITTFVLASKVFHDLSQAEAKSAEIARSRPAPLPEESRAGAL
ncbi:hypothetical protein [Roseibium limicola]|uniref:Uncharacterized protein n=1 Tax=Roseibium limicola TaxID=2816037 RepID=A0A939EML5_9HYPH|nr:hypothetical protein [Roseibium limicola]MBO0343789.1 hypothetical protein [Roseibium limicola]